jgi:hypothetical protein
MIGHSIVPHLHLGNNDNISTSHYNEAKPDHSIAHFLSLIFSNELGEKHLEHVRSESSDIQIPNVVTNLFLLASIINLLQYFDCVTIYELVYFNTIEYTQISSQYFAVLLGNYSFPAPPLA